MLDIIARIFSSEIDDPAGPDDEARLHLAAAVLLIEVAKADHVLEELELRRIREVLARDWGVGETDLQDLMTAGYRTAEQSVSLHEQLDLLNRRLSRQRKFALVRGLWDIACADGQVHHYEEALVRRLADLLHVSHSDFIRSKHQALDGRAGH